MAFQAFQHPIGISSTVNSKQLTKRLLIVNMDLLTIATVCDRLIRQQALRDENRLTNDLRIHYASVDIDLFFMEYRSIFDNIAQVIKQQMLCLKGARSIPPTAVLQLDSQEQLLELVIQ